MTDKKIVVAIPAYNEELTIGSMVIKSKKYSDLIYVIDDGSLDATSHIAEMAGAIVIKHKRNRGYGGAIKSCLKAGRECSADILVTIDGDGQHNPEQIEKVVKPIVDGKVDIVIGSRYVKGAKKDEMPRHRDIGIKVLNAATNFSSKTKVKDSQSGFRAYSKKALSILNPHSDNMSIGSEILIEATSDGLSIGEVPISVRYKGLNGSSQSAIRHGGGVLGSIIHFVKDEHPLMFFMIAGSIALLVGVLLAVITMQIYYGEQGQIPIGTATLAAFFILVGILSIFSALILDSIKRMVHRNLQNRN